MKKERMQVKVPVRQAEELFSLISKAWAAPLADLMIIKAPTPMPLDAGLTTPKQRAAATLGIYGMLPVLEHRPSSVATTPCSALSNTSLLCLFKLHHQQHNNNCGGPPHQWNRRVCIYIHS